MVNWTEAVKRWYQVPVGFTDTISGTQSARGEDGGPLNSAAGMRPCEVFLRCPQVRGP